MMAAVILRVAVTKEAKQAAVTEEAPIAAAPTDAQAATVSSLLRKVPLANSCKLKKN